MPYHIDGPQMGALDKAILSGYPDFKSLLSTLERKLDNSIFEYGDYQQNRWNLITQYNSQWRIDKLLEAMLAEAPGNGDLIALADRLKEPGGSGIKKNLDGPMRGVLSDTMAKAFPDSRKLDRVLTTRLNDNLYQYAGLPDDYDVVRFNLVKDFNSRYHIDRLVLALLEDNSDNGLLLEFAWRHRILKRPPGSNGEYGIGDNSLESVLDPERGFANPLQFLRKFGEMINRVCRITVPRDGGPEYGTGFLIGNDKVITNYHVVEHVINKTRNADRKTVEFLFDYQTDPDGETISKGVPYKLLDHETDWLIDYSPYNPADLSPGDIDTSLKETRPEDNLDYAVLRLAGSPGKTGVGIKPSADAPPRGFVQLPDANKDFSGSGDFETRKSAVFIFQHPREKNRGESDPIRLDWEKPAILGLNQNGTRVYYDVNTRPGSSGSPCLNARLDLIALHHAGVRDWPAENQYLYNRGIPIGKIVALLESRKKLNVIRSSE